MISREVLLQINQLTTALVRLSLSNDQNFPVTHGNHSASFEISVGNSQNIAAALKNVAYRDVYREMDANRCYNIKLLDGALLSLRYRFHKNTVVEHVLSYLSSPDLTHFQNDPETYLEDDIYADVVAKNLVPFPLRFDFSGDITKFVDTDHPYSHLSLGQFKNCRIPVCSPITPLCFGSFILRNFYNTAFRKYSDQLPSSSMRFPKSITKNEQKLMHVVCG